MLVRSLPLANRYVRYGLFDKSSDVSFVVPASDVDCLSQYSCVRSGFPQRSMLFMAVALLFRICRLEFCVTSSDDTGHESMDILFR